VLGPCDQPEDLCTFFAHQGHGSIFCSDLHRCFSGALTMFFPPEVASKQQNLISDRFLDATRTPCQGGLQRHGHSMKASDQQPPI
jgi:hypothetical protein